MGVSGLREWRSILICPRCSSPLEMEQTVVRCTEGTCLYSEQPFPVVAGTPALVDFERSIVSAEQLVGSGGKSQIPRGSRLRRRVGGLVRPRGYRTERNISRMLELLRRDAEPSKRPVILIIGGGTVGRGTADLYGAADVDTLAFDIYWSPLVQLIADGHRIPLMSETFDGVVIQAVLEHVLEPHVVAEQIHRVLRPTGLVYAETPFLQHVHEGAYDFTRFTDSGHRYLFRDFARIDSGVVAGPGTQLVWSIESFVRALFRSRWAGRAARLAVSWLALIDRFLDPRYSIDGACGVYFLGRKSTLRLQPREIVGYYEGAL